MRLQLQNDFIIYKTYIIIIHVLLLFASIYYFLVNKEMKYTEF